MRTTYALGFVLVVGCGGTSGHGSTTETSPVAAAGLPESLSRCLSSPPPACAQASVTTPVVDWATHAPIAGLTVSACPVADIPNDQMVTCAAPASTAITDGSPEVTIQLPTSCGYRAVIDQFGTYAPFDWYFSPPPQGALTDALPVSMATADVLFPQLGGLNVAVDVAEAFAILRVFDCDGSPVAGVSFTVTGRDDATPFTVQAGNMTTATTTDASGQFGFVNLTPGPVTVQAEMGGAKLGDPVTFAVRSGWGTLVDVRPRVAP